MASRSKKEPEPPQTAMVLTVSETGAVCLMWVAERAGLMESRNEYQGIKILVERLKSCSGATNPGPLKVETARNCAKILTDLANHYSTEVKQANARSVATGIVANPNSSPSLVAKAKQLLQALNPASR